MDKDTLSNVNPRIFKFVKAVIDETDYEGFLNSGAPPEEYDLESKMITQRIHPGMDEFQIADVIAIVFNHTLGEPDSYTSEEFYHVAEVIANELMSIPLDEKNS